MQRFFSVSHQGATGKFKFHLSLCLAFSFNLLLLLAKEFPAVSHKIGWKFFMKTHLLTQDAKFYFKAKLLQATDVLIFAWKESLIFLQFQVVDKIFDKGL